jgi:hypothetical protein
MTIRIAVATRTARITAIETDIGTAAKVEIRSGAAPTNLTDADTGTLLASYTLASDWATQASGVLTFAGVPISGTAVGTNTAGHYRVKTNAGVIKMDGSVTATGGGGDMTVDNANITTGQTVQITSWTITDGNP